MPSTVIRSFDYHTERGELRIVFQSGRAYRYLDVSPDIVSEMRAAQSKGSYFNRRVRNMFRFVAEAPRLRDRGARGDNRPSTSQSLRDCSTQGDIEFSTPAGPPLPAA